VIIEKAILSGNSENKKWALNRKIKKLLKRSAHETMEKSS
jgi:hypothetical protein